MSCIDITTISYKDLNEILDFLKPHEYKCLSLVQRLLSFKKTKVSKNQTIYAVKEKGKKITLQYLHGVILITSSGIILHYINGNANIPLTPILKKVNIFSIAGTTEGTEIFQKYLISNPDVVIDYHLMKMNNEGSNVNKKLPEGFKLHKCTIADEKNISNLQMLYQIEEVLPPGKTITEKMCSSLVKDRLLNHTVFCIKDIQTNKFVSMAGTNALGMNYIQLGGIYTDAKFRSRGFAQFLIYSLQKELGSNLILFVKRNNIPAISAYEKSGFRTIDSYRICYM